MRSDDTVVDLKAGRMFGRYQLVAPIASGGMARVWAARLGGIGGFSKICALKIIRPELAKDANFRTMFLDEARIAARLRHRNACEIYDVGEEDGIVFIAMEWVEGVSLIGLLRNETGVHALPHKIGARIVADACAGLHAAHELRGDDGTYLEVVHRDVSPHNVLVASDGTVKLTDFGVAKAEGREQQTQAGEIKGKLLYMSPEQLKSDRVDRRSDIFAMGTVLYEVTTGRRPFGNQQTSEAVRAMLEGGYAKPTSFDPSYPKGLEAIIVRALSVDPDARFPTAEAMRNAIERVLGQGADGSTARVAELVRQRCGEHLIELRFKIGDSGSLPPPSSRPTIEATDTVRDPGETSSLATAVVEVPKKIRARKGAWAFGAAALVAVSAFVTTRALDSEAPHRAQAPANIPSPNVVVPTTATLPAPPATAAASTGSVHFKLSPPNAVLVVDGVTLPAAITAVQTPATGARSVKVRAPGYEERTLTVDAQSPASMTITLAPLTARTKPVASAPHGDALPNPYDP